MNDKLIALLNNPNFKVTLRINEHFRTQMYYDGEKLKHATLEEYFYLLNKGIEPTLIHPDSQQVRDILKHNSIVELYIRGNTHPRPLNFIRHSVEAAVSDAWEHLTLLGEIKS